ncbi:hypothetical protein M231_01338 [Tremella mesenterica]|uniref:Allantoin permease n=1 Tax=Tremella mesenterica TaxID=5217 RepID=A0A4Q1BTZ5_TREME|nr:uncharacterized protein TREMEDRAFT_62830 [Tremella mesenterica DSM 1558]EIW69104.1 hypothetical protein TREMEDRAFT_62830 [Tremella mesenterica DSM 1558]RXK41432.1 hypothetical protein M231_01338 [Tremella mesenterica]
MTFRQKAVEVWKEVGFLRKPQSAIDAGANDFRPVSGWKPFVHMEPGDRTMWINEDLAPTPPQMRTWSWLTYVSLWWGTNYGIGAWTAGSALLTFGLSYKLVIAATCVGQFLIAIVAVGCARVGSRYHIGFPVWARSTFGMNLSKLFVGLRGSVAIIWFAVQNYYCALMLDMALLAVSPNGWGHIANTIPEHIHVTTRQMVAYFICFCLHMPFAFVHPSMIKLIFELKALFLPVVSFGFLGGLIHLAGGSLNFSVLNGTIAKGTSAQSWAFMLGINSCFGGIAPMLINQPDLGRYATTPSAAIIPQAISLWVGNMIVTALGLSAGAASYQIWGVHSWNVWGICELILENNVTSAWRAGIFIFALVQIWATIGTNLFANNIPSACDFSSLWPTKLNIVRAQVGLMIFSWVVQPWSIITTGVKFVIFLNSYTFFCGAMIAILLADYFIVRKGNIHVPSLFAATGSKLHTDGIYYFKPWGCNLVGLVAWLVGIAIPLPGLVASYLTNISPTMHTMVNIYNSGFLIAFGVSGAVYLVGMHFFKPPIVPYGREGEFDGTFESLGKTDGYLPGDALITYGRHSKYDSYDPRASIGGHPHESEGSSPVDEEKKLPSDAYVYEVPVQGHRD